MASEPFTALGPQAARFLALAAAFAAGCRQAPEPPAVPHAQLATGPHEVAVLNLHDLGAIEIELLPEVAPATVDNFKHLAAEGFYDGTTFHRVLPGLLIQGGDPNTRNIDPRDDGAGGPDYTIADEFTDWPQRRGTVSMAHKGTRGTAGSQFFILIGDAPELDGSYAAFGRVVSGMDVVESVTRLQIDKYGRYGPPDRPYPVSAVIDSVQIRPAPDATAAGAAAPPSAAAPQRALDPVRAGG
jgi:cyclophilin family peptidyl-prolyl cis-trans isomerase